jgi:hypothetical protein
MPRLRNAEMPDNSAGWIFARALWNSNRARAINGIAKTECAEIVTSVISPP